MKQHIETSCRHCEAEDLVKNSRSKNGTHRYRCNKCGKSFQHEYTYDAWKPGVKEQIEKQALNNR
ncbi:MAG: IS1/IS1595 family N-terminal zinc-binding domain-containing protein [Candidatus Electronema sp. VV]